MAWQDGAAVLYAQRALEETFYQVAPGTEEGYYHSEAHPAWNAQAMGCTVIGNVTDDDGCDNHEDAATDAAFPTLSRTDARKQLVLAEKRAAAVGTRIVRPEEDEDAQWQEHIIMYLTIECR